MNSGEVVSLSAALPLILNLKGNPYHLEDHAPFEELFRFKMPRTTTYKTGRQVGKTATQASSGITKSVSIPNAPAGTTFKFTNTTGLTPSYGFTLGNAMTTVNFTGTKADVNTALASMQLSTGAAQGAFNFDVTSSITGANLYYNAVTNSYYQYFASTNITWTNARTQAKTKTFNGATGYLVNITTNQENEFIKSNVNASDVWIGASDAAVEGVWRWISL